MGCWCGFSGVGGAVGWGCRCGLLVWAVGVVFVGVDGWRGLLVWVVSVS